MYLSQQKITQLRIRQFLWHSKGMEGADEQMLSVLESLMRVREVVPIWSCAGHARKSKEGGRFYLMFGYTESGFYKLCRLYESIRDGMAQRLYHTILHPQSLELIISSSMWPIRDEDQNGAYPVAILEYKWNTWVEHELFISLVTEQFEQFACEEASLQARDKLRKSLGEETPA